MRWSPLLSVVIGLSIATGRLLSQETPVDEGSDSPQSPPESILCDSNAAHFRLVLGRIELDPVRYRKGTITRKTGQNDPKTARSETLTVDATRGMPRLHYTRQTADQRLTLDVNERGRLSIESEIKTERLLLVQEGNRPILIQHFRGKESYKREADTWIHFYVSDSVTYNKHLRPLVDSLIRGTPLNRLAEAAHLRSLASLSSASITSDMALQRYIEMLGSTQRTTRIEAQRELHQCGISLLPRLRQVDPQSLDAEQRYRVNEIIQQLTPRGEDCESRLAAMIRDDSNYWSAADHRLTGAERILISARMSDLGGSDAVSIANAKSKSSLRVAVASPDDDRIRR
jgi:hypothetical protein